MIKIVVCGCGSITVAARFCRACGKSLNGTVLVKVSDLEVLNALDRGCSVRADRQLYEPTRERHVASDN